jgi:very-short-patch-repair endonuclease
MKKRNPPGYWTKERVIDDARRFPYQVMWIKGSSTSYSVAKKNGWVKEACSLMTSPKVPMGYWTLETLKADAQKYRTKVEWKRVNASAYATALQKDFLAECCAHMVALKNPNGYWTMARCIASAKQFATIQSWALGDPPAYDAAKRAGWMDYASVHMVRIFSHGEHTIYTFLLEHDIEFVYQKRFIELKDKSYLPFDFFLPEYNLVIEYHGRQHFETSQSSMFRKHLPDIQRRDALKEAFAKNTGLEYLQIAVQKIDEIEGSVVKKMQEIAQKQGNLLKLCRRELTSGEQAKLASLGVWIKETVLADARRFSTKTEWDRSESAAAQVARKNGWFEAATAHMTSTQVPKGHWTKNRVFEDARNFTSKIGWISASASAYQTAVSNGWVAEATAHMTRPVYKHATPRGYWTKERVIEDAQGYSTSREWRVASRLAYRHASEKGWLSEATAHMTK